MNDFVVGQKLYAINDNVPIRYDSNRHKGKPYFTFNSCKIVKVNEKTLRIRLNDSVLAGDRVANLKWVRTYNIHKGDVGSAWCITKQELIERELKNKISDLNDAKGEVKYHQSIISRLKGMLRTQMKGYAWE